MNKFYSSFYSLFSIIVLACCLNYFSAQLLAATSIDLPEDVLISDEETEFFIQEILEKLFKAMNIQMKPRVYLVSSHAMNAAATYGGQVIVYTGLITKCNHVGHLIAVLAHESGHIAGGHLARLDEAINKVFVPSMAAIIIGGLATVASGDPAPLLIASMGGPHMLERAIKKHSRTEEESADIAALKVLGEHSIWLMEFFKIIDNNNFTVIHEYESTHPGLLQRIRFVHNYIQQHKKVSCAIDIPESYQERFLCIQKKILAFTRKPQASLDFPANDTSEANLYGRSIYLYRLGQTSKALEVISALMEKKPENPYYKEIKGQILFEQGHVDEAIPYYKEAIAKRPKSSYLKILLARAMLESSQVKDFKITIQWLYEALDKDPRNIMIWRLLAKAYGKMNHMYEASACLAEEAWILDDKKMAKIKAMQGKNAQNKVLARRSRDILKQLADE